MKKLIWYFKIQVQFQCPIVGKYQNYYLNPYLYFLNRYLIYFIWKKLSDYNFCAVFQGKKCPSYAVFPIQNEPGTQHQNSVLINFKSVSLWSPTSIFIALWKCLHKYEFLNKAQFKMIRSSFFKDPYDKDTHKMYIFLWKHWRLHHLPLMKTLF